MQGNTRRPTNSPARPLERRKHMSSFDSQSELSPNWLSFKCTRWVETTQTDTLNTTVQCTGPQKPVHPKAHSHSLNSSRAGQLQCQQQMPRMRGQGLLQCSPNSGELFRGWPGQHSCPLPSLEELFSCLFSRKDSKPFIAMAIANITLLLSPKSKMHH